MEPAAIPLDDEALRWLGVIAVQSARVEWILAGMRSLLYDDVSQMDALYAGHVKNAKAIKQALEREPSWLGEQLTKEAILWAGDASDLLFERGNLLHSSWLVGEAAEDPPIQYHPKSGTEKPLDRKELERLALKLGFFVPMGYAMWVVAMRDGARTSAMTLPVPEDEAGR